MVSICFIIFTTIVRCWRRIFFIPFCLLITACALPRWDTPDQTFVSDKELSAAALDRQGLAYAKQSRLVDAELKFRQGLYLYPQAETISFNLAVVLDQAGLTDESVLIYEDLIKRKPEAVQYRAGLAHAYLSSQNFELAVENYERALAIAEKLGDKKKQSNIARSLSVVYFFSGNEEQAICYSKLARAIDDSNADDMVRHARLMIGTGHAGSVQQQIKDSIEAHKFDKDPRFDGALALLEFALGVFKESADRTDEAYDLSNSLPDLRKDLTVLRKVLPQVLPTPTPSPVPIGEGGQQPQEAISKGSDDSSVAKDDIVIDADLVSGGISLYWPANLLAEAAKLIKTDDEPDS